MYSDVMGRWNGHTINREYWMGACYILKLLNMLPKNTMQGSAEHHINFIQ